MDDILLARSDTYVLSKTKNYLKPHYVTKDMGNPNYFLGIEVADQKNERFLSSRKYALDLCKMPVYLGVNLLLCLWKFMWTFGVKIVKFIIKSSNT